MSSDVGAPRGIPRIASSSRLLARARRMMLQGANAARQRSAGIAVDHAAGGGRGGAFGRRGGLAGGGSVQERTARAAEETARHAKRTADNVVRIVPVFVG